MIRNQKRAILLFCAVAAVLAVVLAVLFNTVWRPQNAEEGETVFMVEPLDMDEIAEITVKNAQHSWRLYRGEDDEMYFEGAEYVLYNQNMVAFLRSCVAYLAVQGEVEEPAEMEEYALSEETCLASFTVTSREGETYRVLVGDKLVSGEGYYARLENEERVWVLPSSLEQCLFGDVTFFLSAQVATALSENNYYEVTNFRLEHGGKPFVEIEMIPEDEASEDDLSTHRVVYPARYEPNTDLVTRIFKSFVTFVGEEVEEYDLASKEQKEFQKLMKDYGFLSEKGDRMHCRLVYTHSKVETELYVSRADEERGAVYVYSPGFDIIAAFDAAALAWTEYDLMEFTQAELYAHSISDVASIEVASADVSTVFTLTHGEKASDLLVVSDRGKVDAEDFRQFYTQLLYVQNEGYATVPDDYREHESLSLTVTLKNGKSQTFVFYDIETLKSYYQVDGEGVFYVNREYTKRLIEGAAKLLSGQDVEAIKYA